MSPPSPHRPLSGLRCSRQHAWLLPRSETVRIRPIPLHTHWSSRGQDSAPVMRIRGFESHPVLSFLIVRVVGHAIVRAATPFVQESCLRGDRHLPGRECSPLSRRSSANQRVGKPGTPRASGARNRRFKSGHADCSPCEALCWYRPVTVDHQVEGSIPSLAALLVPSDSPCGSPPPDV